MEMQSIDHCRAFRGNFVDDGMTNANHGCRNETLDSTEVPLAVAL